MFTKCSTLKMVNNKKGFSLIELMVVVAIIGLLAAIGVPQFQKFQAKSRQSEAKSLLNTIYVSEASFKSEWNGYTTNLKNAGAAVSGNNLRYTGGFNDAACGGYPAGAPTETAGQSQTHMDAVSNATAGTANWYAGIFTANTAITFAAPTVPTCAAATFMAGVTGDPRNTVSAWDATTSDSWTINQNKSVVNTVSGL